MMQLQKSKAKQPQSKSTTCDFEYICSKSAITPLPEKETRVPYKICSFDIEASSSHGDFPAPIKSYKRLVLNDAVGLQQSVIFFGCMCTG